LAAVAVMSYADLDDHDPEIGYRLQHLVRPSLGHWWEFVRRLLPVLAEGGDPGFQTVRDLLLGRTRNDLPRAAGLYSYLRELESEQVQASSRVRLTELYDRFVWYRNHEIGHGASGQRTSEFYARMGRTILAGVIELLGRLDVLAGRRLFLVADVRRLHGGNWLVETFELMGETPRRVESLELPSTVSSVALPSPNRLYLIEPGEDVAARSIKGFRGLHPLILFDAEEEDVFFLNTRRGEKTCEYLSYCSGQVIRRAEVLEDQRQLLARLKDAPIESRQADEWAAASMAEEGATPEPEIEGARALGEFEILSRVASGGMGVVYRAWQPSLGRQVALKVLIRSGDPKAEARFAREIHALGRVEHPHLIKVFTSGAHGDQWFYTMELVEGVDLAAICQRLSRLATKEVNESDWYQALSQACQEARKKEETLSDSVEHGELLAKALRGTSSQAGLSTTDDTRTEEGVRGGRRFVARMVGLIRQAADAAHSLHEAGVIHRDIKPANILITPDGNNAILMDLGLAQLTDDAEGRLTRTRQFVGTIRYASPEQLLAASTLDRRSDVYSLGATLHELLTLRPLFNAGPEMSTPDLMLNIQSGIPERPSRCNPNIPADLDAIVLKCLEKQPNRRYATAAELAEDLERWERGDPVVAQPPTLRYVLGKYVQRHRWRVSAAIALVLLLLAVGIGSFVIVNQARMVSSVASRQQGLHDARA
jgi:serine/threonine protein kinase